MSGRRVVKGKALRATCPECGRSIACYMDRAALDVFQELSYLLQPHNESAGQKCKGWRVYRGDLEPRASALAPVPQNTEGKGE